MSKGHVCTPNCNLIYYADGSHERIDLTGGRGVAQDD